MAHDTGTMNPKNLDFGRPIVCAKHGRCRESCKSDCAPKNKVELELRVLAKEEK